MRPYEQLEQELGDAVVCSSGTAALHLAFEALQLPQGGEVIMSDFNMIACPRAATLAGLKPVFVDCDERLLIDPELVERAININTVAILATHVYGRRCEMDTINRIATERNLAVVEDLAEAFGVEPHRSTDAACWSFYRNKIVAGEEGGAVRFLCKEATRIARQLRSLGFTDAHDYCHIPRGHNYRLADCLAEKVLESLHNLKWSQHWRRFSEKCWDATIPTEWHMPTRDAVWVYDIRIPRLQNIDEVVAALRTEGIEARHSFKPMCGQEEFKAAPRYHAHIASREVLYLPVSPDMKMVPYVRARKLIQSKCSPRN